MQQPTPCHACPLRARGPFKSNTAEEIDFIQVQKAAEVTLGPGATIVTEGQKGDRLFTVLEGWAFRYKTLPDGRRQILNILLPGDLVGLQGKLFDEAAHGVEALTMVTLCAFSRERTFDMFVRFPALAFDLTWLCAHEERIVDDVLLSVGRRTAMERMAMLVVHLWHRAEQLGMLQNQTLPWPLTQAHVADVLGLSAVHVNRTLQALRRRRLFVLTGGTLANVDLDGLKRLSRYDPPTDPRPLY